jgi:hypothetical protein
LHAAPPDNADGSASAEAGVAAPNLVRFHFWRGTIYLIEFWVDLAAEELKVHEATAQDDAIRHRKTIGWSGYTHLVVR